MKCAFKEIIVRRLFRFLIDLLTIPIHSYVFGPFPLYTCRWCGHQTSLSGWQIAEMPKSMAYCPAGKPSVKFKYDFNCLDKSEKPIEKSETCSTCGKSCVKRIGPSGEELTPLCENCVWKTT